MKSPQSLGAILIVSVFLASSACGQDSLRFAFTRPLMGTDVRIVLYATDSLVAAEAAESAFDRITELNSLLSDYLVESELNRLSSTNNRLVSVSEDLWNVLSTAQKISRLSEGAFDVTVGPLTLLWRRAMRRNVLPDSIDLQEAMAVVGFEFLQLNDDDKTTSLEKKNMRLDLGGIAKGYIADQVLRVLVRGGFPNSAVDVGGDIALGEAPPNTDGWHIEVFESKTDTEILLLTNCGIAVSGDTYQYLKHKGVRYSHIVNPETGYGVTHERKVAVIAPSAMLADAWASAYSVMDWQKVVLGSKTHDLLSIRVVEHEDKEVRQIDTGKFGE